MTPLLLIFFFFLGALFASFVTVISERAYTGQSWKTGRSKCNSCRKVLTALDLIPVFSWLVLRGRCRHCGSRLPITYVLTEAVLGTLFALAFGSLGLVPALPIMFAALVTLTFVVLYDLRHTVVPIAGSVLLFIFSSLFALLTSSGSPELGLSLLSAGLVALFLFLLYALSQGRAMGLGDAPVALSLALLVGGGQALAGLLFSFWIGALFGVAILLRRPGGPTMGLEVPFVPFMAVGFLLAYFTQWNPFPFFAL